MFFMSAAKEPEAADSDCPYLRKGEACQRYIKVHWSLRFLAAAVGAAVPLVAAAKKVLQNPPHPEFEPVVWAIAFLLVFCSFVGIAWTLHHEKDMPTSFIAGVGLPALFFTLLNFI
jgi:hypothetical protein